MSLEDFAAGLSIYHHRVRSIIAYIRGFEPVAEHLSPLGAFDLSMARVMTTIDLELESLTAGFDSRMRLVACEMHMCTPRMCSHVGCAPVTAAAHPSRMSDVHRRGQLLSPSLPCVV